MDFLKHSMDKLIMMLKRLSCQRPSPDTSGWVAEVLGAVDGSVKV